MNYWYFIGKIVQQSKPSAFYELLTILSVVPAGANPNDVAWEFKRYKKIRSNIFRLHS